MKLILRRYVLLASASTVNCTSHALPSNLRLGTNFWALCHRYFCLEYLLATVRYQNDMDTSKIISLDIICCDKRLVSSLKRSELQLDEKKKSLVITTLRCREERYPCTPLSDNFSNSPQVAAPRRPREIDQSMQHCSTEAYNYTRSAAPSRSKGRLIDIIPMKYIIYTHNFYTNGKPGISAFQPYAACKDPCSYS